MDTENFGESLLLRSGNLIRVLAHDNTKASQSKLRHGWIAKEGSDTLPRSSRSELAVFKKKSPENTPEKAQHTEIILISNADFCIL